MTISILIVSFRSPVREEGYGLDLASYDLNRYDRVGYSYRVNDNKDGGAFIDDLEAPYSNVHRDSYNIDSYAFYG